MRSSSQEQSMALHQGDGKQRRGGKTQRPPLVLTVSVQEGREGTGGSEGSRTFIRALSDGLIFVGMSRHTHCREAIFLPVKIFPAFCDKSPKFKKKIKF